MSKQSTEGLINTLKEIGESIGFISKREVHLSYLLSQRTSLYDPRFDLVWFYDISKYNPSGVKLVFPEDGNIPDLIPVVAFEVEGSTTTSKNQVGNINNLSACPSLFKFLVTDNEGASNENDTYRRGVRICRTIRGESVSGDFVVADKAHILGLRKTSFLCDTNLDVVQLMNFRSAGCGGESKSTIETLCRVIEALQQSTKFSVKQDYKPPQFKWRYSSIRSLMDLEPSSEALWLALGLRYFSNPKQDEREVNKIGDYFYVPKIDIAIDIPLPIGFTQFLNALSDEYSYDRIPYSILNYAFKYPGEPIAYPLLGIEYETSCNKHLNGGVVNLSKYFYKGILMCDGLGLSHLDYLRERGINNVYHKNIKEV